MARKKSTSSGSSVNSANSPENQTQVLKSNDKHKIDVDPFLIENEQGVSILQILNEGIWKKRSQGGIAVLTLIRTTCIFSLWSSQGNGAITITMNVLVKHLIYHPPVPLSTNRQNITIIVERHKDKIKEKKDK